MQKINFELCFNVQGGNIFDISNNTVLRTLMYIIITAYCMHIVQIIPIIKFPLNIQSNHLYVEQCTNTYHISSLGTTNKTAGQCSNNDREQLEAPLVFEFFYTWTSMGECTYVL